MCAVSQRAWWYSARLQRPVAAVVAVAPTGAKESAPSTAQAAAAIPVLPHESYPREAPARSRSVDRAARGNAGRVAYPRSRRHDGQVGERAAIEASVAGQQPIGPAERVGGDEEV
jgi:hypothetical protein